MVAALEKLVATDPDCTGTAHWLRSIDE
jgi:hypothetical protein